MNSLWKKKPNTVGLKPAATTIRITDKPKPKPLPSKEKEEKALAARRGGESARAPAKSRKQTAIPPSSSKDSARLPVKRKASRQISPSTKFSDDDDESEDDGSPASFVEKRNKVSSSALVDLKRKLRSRKAFSAEEGSSFEMIHAADTTSGGRKSRSGDPEYSIIVELKYPNTSQLERYVEINCGQDKRLIDYRYELFLRTGTDDNFKHTFKDMINAFEEIFVVANIVTDVYLTKDQAKPFKDPNTGYIRRLERAKGLLKHNKDGTQTPQLLDGFKKAVDAYNNAIGELLNDGALARNLDAMHHLPEDMVHYILGQVYDRTVSPKVESLREYENGSDNVYGELRPSFISKLLTEVELKSDQVFVDLGSGVGNVVIQAALEFGCESWGCEMMQNAYTLADAQKKEFDARCRLWGIAPGEVHLKGDSFLSNKATHEAMKRADVILVNNHVFTPQTNRSLIDLFLDLKDGCKIISMKNFVPDDHVAKRNSDDPVNILDVVKKSWYDADSVSWGGVGGNYFVAVKRPLNEEV